MSALEIDTPHGLARAHVHPPPRPAEPNAALVLGHGAGGSITAPDLVAVANAALQAGYGVALVEQPYRVAGRRTAAPAPQLDAAWIAVLAHLCATRLEGLPIIAGGRSSGARVACRTAAATGAAAVLCLAFPLRPPRRPDAPSRQPELDAVQVPTLVVQGDRDAFGRPEPGPRRRVVIVPGDHRLGSGGGHDAIAAAVTAWLADIAPAGSRALEPPVPRLPG
jgi:predicted alpha/beta-hydrolase family hydrolase